MDDRSMKQSIYIFLSIIALCSSSFQVYPSKRSFDLNEYLRIRCSLDSKQQTVITWKGSVYIHMYQTRPERIFDLVGMNVARCLFNEEKQEIVLTTREIQLYLHPVTGQKLIQWRNPYTGQNVTVVHVANDPVQSNFSSAGFSINGYVTGSNQAVIPIDLNLYYPNPLYENTTLRMYSKEPFYQSSEVFKFFTPLDQVVNKKFKQVDQLDMAWTKTSPVLPWMNMSQQGTAMLLFSVHGSKVKNWTQIDPVLFDEINNRVPIYRNAPACHLNAPSETAWTYFKKYFSQYLSTTEEFPIPKSEEDAPCLGHSVHN